MARSRLCRVCNDFHDLAKPWPHNCAGHFGVVADSAPFVLADGMDPIECPANGRMYDSRSAYYRAVRESGGVIVEPGMVAARRAMSGPPVGETMKRAFQQLQNR